MGSALIEQKIIELKSANKSFVVVCLLEITGSAPQEVGAKAIIGGDGLIFGTIGGGKVELSAIEFSKELLQEKDAPIISLKKWNLQRDIKMTCGGEVLLSFEKYSGPKFKIAIFGAGHVSQELSFLLSKLHCQVTFIDDRTEWLQKLTKAPNIVEIQSSPMELAVKNFDHETFFLSITKGHSFDVPVVKSIFEHFPNAPYVGVIGSASKRNAIIKELREFVSAEFIEKLRIPVGMPFGDNTPYEIALSIVAELVSERDIHLKS